MKRKLKRGEIIALVFYILISVVPPVIIEFIQLVKDTDTTSINYGLLFALLSPFIGIPLLILIGFLIYLIHRKIYNTGKRHLFVYASKSEMLLHKSNAPKSLLYKYEVNENKDQEKEEEEKAVTGFKFIRAIKSVILVYLLLVAAISIYGLITGFKWEALLIGIGIITLAMIVPVIFLLLTRIPDSKPYFSREKINAVKEFDEKDDNIKITDYKIYKKEMYIKIPCDGKEVYALITKKNLVVITFDDKQIQYTTSLNRGAVYTDEDDERVYVNVKEEYKDMYENTSANEYKIKGKDLIEVLEFIRDNANN